VCRSRAKSSPCARRRGGWQPQGVNVYMSRVVTPRLAKSDCCLHTGIRFCRAYREPGRTPDLPATLWPGLGKPAPAEEGPSRRPRPIGINSESTPAPATRVSFELKTPGQCGASPGTPTIVAWTAPGGLVQCPEITHGYAAAVGSLAPASPRGNHTRLPLWVQPRQAHTRRPRGAMGLGPDAATQTICFVRNLSARIFSPHDTAGGCGGC
jgi:hypothetical protein